MKMNDYTFILEFKIIMLIVDFSVHRRILQGESLGFATVCDKGSGKHW